MKGAGYRVQGAGCRVTDYQLTDYPNTVYLPRWTSASGRSGSNRTRLLPEAIRRNPCRRSGLSPRSDLAPSLDTFSLGFGLALEPFCTVSGSHVACVMGRWRMRVRHSGLGGRSRRSRSQKRPKTDPRSPFTSGTPPSSRAGKNPLPPLRPP